MQARRAGTVARRATARSASPEPPASLNTEQALLALGFLIVARPAHAHSAQILPASLSGADGGTRTRTGLPPRDFKSLASTGSATSAWGRFYHIRTTTTPGAEASRNGCNSPASSSCARDRRAHRHRTCRPPGLRERASRAAFADRRLEREPGFPGKIDPGVLRHFRDEGVDQRPAHRLGIDGGEMRLRQQAAHDARRAAGVDEIVDDHDAAALAAGKRDDALGWWFEHFELALLARLAVARHAHGLDDPQIELARDDRGRHQAAARDAHNRLERPHVDEPPGERPGIAMERVPGDRKDFLELLRHREPPRIGSERTAGAAHCGWGCRVKQTPPSPSLPHKVPTRGEG